MVARLVLVLADQLSENLSALRQADQACDVVVMAEVRSEATYVKHHPKKIAFLFAAMRKFAGKLRDAGWTVDYTPWDDPDNAGSIPAELLRRAQSRGASEVLATRCGEWRLIHAVDAVPLTMRVFEDDRFIASHAMFDAWANGRKQLRMEYFYREMRRKTGLLMDGDKPVGGKWNYDHDNRKAPPKGTQFVGPKRFAPDTQTQTVLDLVAAEFDDHFGELQPFWFATDHAQAQQALAHFIAHALPQFGDYQDAMLDQDRFLAHSVLAQYMNAGLLDPLETCRAAEAAYLAGDAPLNAVEGFIRQIIGWREFMRGIYFHEGPDYTRRNVLEHTAPLPEFFWGGPTEMRCVAKAVEQTRTDAYAHHIQRLMILGNFALLAGIDPAQVSQWYLAVYADAYEWVEAPNVIGMSQFADGGIVGSKPYVSSGSYIDRMSDHCKTCTFSPKIKLGEGACPFNLLYWGFLDRHRDRFEQNPRMAQMYRTWDRMDADKRAAILAQAAQGA